MKIDQYGKVGWKGYFNVINDGFAVLKGSKFVRDLKKLLDSKGLRPLGEEVFVEGGLFATHIKL